MAPALAQFLVLVCILVPLCAEPVFQDGLTRFEAGSWSIRRAVQGACDRDRQPLEGYRACLAGAVLEEYKSRFVVYELSDPCQDRRRCQIPDADVAKVKNCFNTVSVVNKGLPYFRWHANLYEDIMVGCLAKETLPRIARYAPKGTSDGSSFTTPQLKALLNGAFAERSELQARIVTVCSGLK